MKGLNIPVGSEFGRLTVVGFVTVNGRRHAQCSCSCGSSNLVAPSDLIRGASRSCGCLRREIIGNAFRTHGLCQHPLYATWANMRRRCTDPSNPHFQDYGGRGIQVCARWGEFDLFLADMGEKPTPSHTLERKDVDGDYCPSNCEWATRTRQARNKRNSLFVTLGGEQRNLADAAESLGLNYWTAYSRVKDGRDLTAQLQRIRRTA